MPDPTDFETLVQVLVFGCACWKIADESRWTSTLRRRCDEWSSAEVMERLQGAVVGAYDPSIRMHLADGSVGQVHHPNPCGREKAGKSLVDRRGKQRIKAADQSLPRVNQG